MFSQALEKLMGTVSNLGKRNPKVTYVHPAKQVLVLKRTVFEGKDFQSSLEFLQLQLSNRYKEQRWLSLGQNLIKEFDKERAKPASFSCQASL